MTSANPLPPVALSRTCLVAALPKLMLGLTPVVTSPVSSTVHLTTAADPLANSTIGVKVAPLVVRRTNRWLEAAFVRAVVLRLTACPLGRDFHI